MPAQEQQPAIAAQREAQVVDAEGRQQPPGVGAEDEVDQLVELEVGQGPVDQDQDDDGQDDRDDRPRVAQAAR